MKHREALNALFKEHGYKDFKWIDPKKIVVSSWVRMKCRFGCGEYGKNACCPPNTPDIQECREFFRDYKEAVVFHFAAQVEKPEDRFAWTKEINLNLVKLEREVFISGYRKAFLLVMDSCNFCEDCPGVRSECKNPKKSRPAPEAMGVDVFATVRGYGFPIEVLHDYSQRMNRYAFLMVD